jgi:cholesterol transport system auxiliary component
MRTAAIMHLHRQLYTVILGALLLGGCASEKPANNTVFDLGPAVAAPGAAPTSGAVTALVVADVTGSAALDNERMFYRLNYADPLEARTYAHSRWTASPLQLLTQRFKVRLAQSGLRVLSTTDAADGLPILRIEIDDFNHGFDSVTDSHGHVAVRASLVRSNKLLDQRSFSRRTPAGANAAGGARALAASTDAVAADIAAWLATVPAAVPAAQR